MIVDDERSWVFIGVIRCKAPLAASCSLLNTLPSYPGLVAPLLYVNVATKTACLHPFMQLFSVKYIAILSRSFSHQDRACLHPFIQPFSAKYIAILPGSFSHQDRARPFMQLFSARYIAILSVSCSHQDRACLHPFMQLFSAKYIAILSGSCSYQDSLSPPFHAAVLC